MKGDKRLDVGFQHGENAVDSDNPVERRFSNFRLDYKAKLLSRETGEEVFLGPSRVKVLVKLAECAGELVKKNDLIDAGWGVDSSMVEDDLRHAIEDIRKALGDAGGSRFIETVTRRGYKFVAEFDTAEQKTSEPLPRKHFGAASVIDRAFIDSSLSGPAFPREQFYAAEQGDPCQWYGILNNYDVLRNDYGSIKKAAITSFDRPTTSKVCCIVYGPGGSGKSTVLRRLAVGLADETTFRTIWVDAKLEHFVAQDLLTIEREPSTNYLVILEDWYRLACEAEIGRELLRRCEKLNNVRLVIGDRDVQGKEYRDHAKDRNIFPLTTEENAQILNEVVETTAWGDAAKTVLSSTGVYSSPLFLILFAIAAVSAKRIEMAEVDIDDFANLVRRIARYDLRRINERSPGIAKALRNWGCICAKRPIPITWSSFLRLADAYDNSDSNTRNFHNHRQDDNVVLEVLRQYVNVRYAGNHTVKAGTDPEVLYFNHDTLADSVISQVSLDPRDHFDSPARRYLLDVMIEKGDEYSAANVLRHYLDLEKNIFRDDLEKVAYVDRLFFDKGNRAYHYLYPLVKLTKGVQALWRYLEELKSENLFPQGLWLNYFKIGSQAERESAVHAILTSGNLLNIPGQVVASAFKCSRNDQEREEAAAAILASVTRENLGDLPDVSVAAAFRQPVVEEKKREAASIILTSEHLFELSEHVYAAACEVRGNTVAKVDATLKLLRGLRHLDSRVLNPNLVSAAFARASDDPSPVMFKARFEASLAILEQKQLLGLHPTILLQALMQDGPVVSKAKASSTRTFRQLDDVRLCDLFEALKSERAKSVMTDLADLVLSSNGVHFDLESGLIGQLFRIPGNDNVKGQFAESLLTAFEPTTIAPPVDQQVFRWAGLAARTKTAHQLVSCDRWYRRLSPVQVIGVMRVASVDAELLKKVEDVFGIMRELPRDNDHLGSYLYYGLLAIPFNGIEIWERATDRIRSEWPSLDRRAVNAILQLYKKEPMVITDVCEGILRNWHHEITEPFSRWFRPKLYGTHVQRAAGPSRFKRAGNGSC